MPAENNYWFYREHGICTKCGQRDALPGRTRCEECAYKDNERHVRAYHAMTRERLNEINAAKRAGREKRVEAGICSKCGKKLTDKRYKMCLECRLYARRWKKENIERKRWKESGLCWHCGDENVVDGKTLCRECLDKQRLVALANLEKATGKSDNSYFRRLNNAMWEGKQRKADKKQGARQGAW